MSEDDKHPGLRRAISQGRGNWTGSDLPFGKRLRLLARNEWRKVSRLKSCCGHPGEPGC